jgi:hypothetical protein
MLRPVLLSVALLIPLVAGCAVPSADTSAASTTDAVQAAAAPTLDAKATLAELKLFAEKFPVRRGDNDAHKAARAYLEAAFKQMGYTDVFQDEYHAKVAPSTPTNLAGSDRLANVCAMHWGATHKDEWIVVGAHFDVTDGAVYGAYDDGSGTLIVQHLARAFANVTTDRTIVFCNFDGEEQGLTGSTHMFKAVLDGSWKHAGTVVGMEDFDMAGINYPAPPPLVADVRSPEMKALIQNESAALKMPEKAVQYRGISGGSSDNGPFKAGQVPSVLFISDFDDVEVATPAGVVKLPGHYPFWHQLDTYEGMVQLAGSEADLVKGFQNVEDIGSALLFAMSSGMGLTFE